MVSGNLNDNVRNSGGSRSEGGTENNGSSKISNNSTYYTNRERKASRDFIRRSKRVKPLMDASMLTISPSESLVENRDRPPGAFAVGPYAHTGIYEGKNLPMIGAFARASTGDTQAHVGPMHAKANGPMATTGAHASLLGVGAFANAEVGRLEATLGGITAGLGLNFNTGASIGVDGISVNALGFGVSVGPQIAIRTPVADMSCTIL